MYISLRMRLVLLVCLAIACSMGITLFETSGQIENTILHMEKQNFSIRMQGNIDTLNTIFTQHLAQNVSTIITRKTHLRETAARGLSLWQQEYANVSNEEQLADRLNTLLASMEAESRKATQKANMENVCLEVVQPKEILSGTPSRLGLTAALNDAKKRDLTHIFTSLNSAGDFSVFDLPKAFSVAGTPLGIAQKLTHPVLVYMLPLTAPAPKSHGTAPTHGTASRPHGTPPAPTAPRQDTPWVDVATGMPAYVLVAMIPLVDLQAQSQRAKKQSIASMAKNFAKLSQYPHGSIMLLDGKGAVLAHGGTASLSQDVLQECIEKMRGTALTYLTTPGEYGEMACLIGQIRAFDWYMFMGAPISEIRAPLDALLKHLGTVALGIALLATLVALVITVRALRPLHLLTAKTQQIAAVDLRAHDAPEQLEPLIAQGLPLERHDELGQLARSFAQMGRALGENIRSLMTATANKERLEGELNAARDIQMGILPPPDGAPELCGFSAAAFLDPAREVGGDLYDYFLTKEGKRALVLGDVSGKGVPAALFMSMTVTLVRYALNSGINPAEAMTRVNALLEEHNPDNMFVTLFLALYDPASGELLYANGGHCPPYIVNARADSPLRTLDGLSGPLVGVMPDVDYALFQDHIDYDDLCLLFTDGVSEAMNAKQELFGEQRIQQLLLQYRTATPRALVTKIFMAIQEYRGDAPQSDDITMLAFHRPRENDTTA